MMLTTRGRSRPLVASSSRSMSGQQSFTHLPIWLNEPSRHVWRKQFLQEGSQEDVRRYIRVDQLPRTLGRPGTCRPRYRRTSATSFERHRGVELLHGEPVPRTGRRGHPLISIRRKKLPLLRSTSASSPEATSIGGPTIFDFFDRRRPAFDELVPAVEQVLRDPGRRSAVAVPGRPRIRTFGGRGTRQSSRRQPSADARLFPAEPGPLVPLSRVKSSPSTRCSPSSAEPRGTNSSICRLWKVVMASRTSARCGRQGSRFTPTMFGGYFFGSIVFEDEFEIDDDQFAQLGSAFKLPRTDARAGAICGRGRGVGRGQGRDAGLALCSASAGLVPLPPHDLRRTAVALSSPNPKEVAGSYRPLVGQFHPRRYGHLLPGSDQRLNDALDDLAKRLEQRTASQKTDRADTELPDSTAHADGIQIRRRRHATLEQGLLGGPWSNDADRAEDRRPGRRSLMRVPPWSCSREWRPWTLIGRSSGPVRCPR